jgi:hypothetical protein
VRLWLFVLPLLVPMALAIGRAMQYLTIRRWMAFALALWVLVMLAFKGFVPGYRNAEDARQFDAREFAEAIRPFVSKAGSTALGKTEVSQPTDIAFFETAPLYGLKFYLNANLLRVAHDVARDASFDLRFRSLVARPFGRPTTPERDAINEAPERDVRNQTPDRDARNQTLVSGPPRQTSLAERLVWVTQTERLPAFKAAARDADLALHLLQTSDGFVIVRLHRADVLER